MGIRAEDAQEPVSELRERERAHTHCLILAALIPVLLPELPTFVLEQQENVSETCSCQTKG